MFQLLSSRSQSRSVMAIFSFSISMAHWPFFLLSRLLFLTRIGHEMNSSPGTHPNLAGLICSKKEEKKFQAAKLGSSADH